MQICFLFFWLNNLIIYYMIHRKICSRLHHLNWILKTMDIVDNEASVRYLKKQELKKISELNLAFFF